MFGTDDISIYTTPCQVNNVEFRGLVRTKNSLADVQARGIFESTTINQIMGKTLEMTSKFETHGIFHACEPEVEIFEGEGGKHLVNIKMDVKETRPLNGKVYLATSAVGSDSLKPSLVTGVSLPNMSGAGDSLNADLSVGESSVGSLYYKYPILGNLDHWLTFGFAKESLVRPSTTAKQKEDSIFVSYSRPTIWGIQSEVKLQHAIRNVSAHGRPAAAVRYLFGSSSKSSVEVSIKKDTRDVAALPTNGYNFKLATELAGLIGDAQFFKVSEQYNVFKTLGNVTFQFGSGFGLIYGLSGSPQSRYSPHFPDRYFLGGPLFLRGFQQNSVGPSSNGQALGSTGYYQTGLHVYPHLPYSVFGDFGKMCRPHVWACAGNMAAASDLINFRQNALANARISVGAGFVFKFGDVIRLEINLCQPLRYVSTDLIKQGLEFGIGVEYC